MALLGFWNYHFREWETRDLEEFDVWASGRAQIKRLVGAFTFCLFWGCWIFLSFVKSLQTLPLLLVLFARHCFSDIICVYKYRSLPPVLIMLSFGQKICVIYFNQPSWWTSRLLSFSLLQQPFFECSKETGITFVISPFKKGKNRKKTKLLILG